MYAADRSEHKRTNTKGVDVIDTRKLDPIPDAQAYLGGIGRTKLYELAKEHHVDIVKIGSRSFVTRESRDKDGERLATSGSDASLLRPNAGGA